MTQIKLSRVHFPISTLGPGNRLGIWMQGCSIRCKGCISADTWANGNEQSTVQDLLSSVSDWLSLADGVTISGGEPFDQPEALRCLLIELRKRNRNADILVYSGYSKELLEPHLSEMVDLIDCLISDPYLIEETDELPLRGSDNQRLTTLTPLGNERFYEYKTRKTKKSRKFDFMIEEGGEVWLAGIPRRDDFRKLEAVMSAQNHKIYTSQDRS